MKQRAIDFNASFNRLMRLKERERTVITDADQQPLKVNVKMRRTDHGDNEARSLVGRSVGVRKGGRRSRAIKGLRARKGGFIR